jgi:hypothetical protein
MKCPKCRYTSFPHLENCPKCGVGLAEQRAALGIYALRPDPPDLLLAYQAASMDIAGGMPTSAVSALGIDLGPLEGIDLDIAEATPRGAGTHEMAEPPNVALPSVPTLEHEIIEEDGLAPEEGGSERLSTQEVIMPQSLDLSQLGDITLTLDNAADLEGESPESAQTPREFADVKQVYDLDVDEDLDALTLGPSVDGPGADDDDEEAAAYTLEIEEELEFEVDGLELEQDDAGDDEDDDDR